jgi:hypothetical protein
MRPVSQLMIAMLFSTTSCTDDAASTGPSAPAIAFAEVTRDIVINQPLEIPDWFIPCVNGGAGELVDFTGALTGVAHVTVNDNRFVGRVSVTTRLDGVGESTGQHYHFRDMIASGQSEALLTEQVSYTAAFATLITTAGPGNNLLVRGTRHLTLGPNGEFTANFDKFSFDECK